MRRAVSRRGGRAEQERGLRDHLGLESASSDDRDFIQPGFRRQPAAWIDETMHRAPTKAADPAGRGPMVVATQRLNADRTPPANTPRPLSPTPGFARQKPFARLDDDEQAAGRAHGLEGVRVDREFRMHRSMSSARRRSAGPRVPMSMSRREPSRSSRRLLSARAAAAAPPDS